MKKADIIIGGVYSNGAGRVRRIIDMGPQYKLYPGAASEENVRYEVVLDGSKRNSTAGKQANMSLQAFASWAKERAPEPNAAPEVSMPDGKMSVSAAVSLLEKRAAKYHPCDPIVDALQMAIDALKESEWFDAREQPPVLPDEDVCGLPLLVKTEEDPDRTAFMVYQRSCPRGKRKEQWLYQGHVYDGVVLRWRMLPK